MSITLRTGRQALHAHVVALLAGNGVDVNDIKNFRTAQFSNNPTHVVVGTLLMEAEQLTLNESDPGFVYFIQGLARYSDEDSSEAADDLLDELQYLLITGLSEHTQSDPWEALDIVGTPPRTARKIGSHNYKIFEIRVKLESD